VTALVLVTILLAQGLPPSARMAKPPKVRVHQNAAPGAESIATAREKARARGVAATGVHVPLAPKAFAEGRWHKLPGGGSVWLLQLESRGAQALRLHVKGFAAGAGQLWVHAGKEVSGPYTGQGPHGDGEFWTDTIFAPVLTLEFLPAGAPPKALPFTVDLLSHQF